MSRPNHMKLESKFQREVIKDISTMFPGSMVLKTDPQQIQGVPDLLVLYKDRWAALEVKRTMPKNKRDYQPNQEWYIEHMHDMSYASVICPENKDSVFEHLQKTFK